MNTLNLSDLLLKTNTFYVPNFGELTTVESDDEVRFVNSFVNTKLVCKTNSVFKYTQDDQGNDYFIFSTFMNEYKVYPVIRHHLKIGNN